MTPNNTLTAPLGHQPVTATEITARNATRCPDCDGSGGYVEWLYTTTCEACEGTGEVSPKAPETNTLTVPERFRADTNEEGYWL